MVKYTIRNFMGDANAIWIGAGIDPFKPENFGRAARDLGDVVFNQAEASRELREWFYLGGQDSGIFQSELKQSERELAAKFAQKLGAKWYDTLLETGWSIPQAILNAPRPYVVYLESLLRYSTYLSYKSQLQENGVPDNYGASRKDEIDKLNGNETKAYWLSNQLAGAYDQVSVAGQSLRETGIPFWSFQEINMKRFWRLTRNAMRDDDLTTAVARKKWGRAFDVALKRSPMTALSAARLLTRLMALELAMMGWNHWFFPEAEEKLSRDERRTPHIILGIPFIGDGLDSKGNVRSFNRLSVFGEAREWLGIDEFLYGLPEVAAGRKSFGDLAWDTALSPAEKLVNSLGPTTKAGIVRTAVELMAGIRFFPRASKPSPIRDRVEHAFSIWGLEKEWKALVSKAPLKTGGTGWLSRLANSFRDVALYRTEPGAAAYYNTLSDRRQFRKNTGKGEGGFHFHMDSKSNALFNYKRALRYEQKDLAMYHLAAYAGHFTEKDRRYGVPGERLAQSINSMHPLQGIRKNEREFRAWLGDEEETLDRAIQYFEKVLATESDLIPRHIRRRILRTGEIPEEP